jgi:hypothetical protein
MLMVAAALAAALLRLAAVGSATNDSSTGPMPVPVPTALANHTADPYFPIYHVRPDDGWHTNDPNGPFFFRGVFHLFSQCRQMAAVMPIPPGGWCHYASKDLVKWRRLGYPLRPDRSYDNISLDTGSATIVDGVPTMLIPGVESHRRQRQFHLPSLPCGSSARSLPRQDVLRGACESQRSMAQVSNQDRLRCSAEYCAVVVGGGAILTRLLLPAGSGTNQWRRIRSSMHRRKTLSRTGMTFPKPGRTSRQVGGGRLLGPAGVAGSRHPARPAAPVLLCRCARPQTAAFIPPARGFASPAMNCG